MHAADNLRDVHSGGPLNAPAMSGDLQRVPRDRPIEVQIGRSASWHRVKWYPQGVAQHRGLPTVTGLWESRERECFYIEPTEVVAWRPIRWPDD